MARKIVHQLVDDLDGTVLEVGSGETILFSLDGTAYEIDLTDENAAALRDALAALPRELVLVETDAPYLTPIPWRGCPNASYVMAHTVRFIAELWGVSEAAACDQLRANTEAVYGSWW